MAKTKPRPERVHPATAQAAYADAGGDWTACYSYYIIRRYRATGSLAPGCDARDLVSWYEANGYENKGKK